MALRSEPEIRGDENLVGDRLPTGTRLISIERLNSGWHKVITLDGRMGYCSGDYLDIINDINTCNERVIVKTNDGIGINVRNGPGTGYKDISKLPDGTTGTRLIRNIYYNKEDGKNGITWDLVLFDNGVKGFVATDYLTVI